MINKIDISWFHNNNIYNKYNYNYNNKYNNIMNKNLSIIYNKCYFGILLSKINTIYHANIIKY